ncbi:hypothetical protein GH714_032949 [Hevea brasiliensis]|uniref:Reverse transcriptase domain-containing protein n=1 Tax=Hevea brasiliensis TaxID=3981 RepID=A0A6A6L470_HEVBR|nr:hypothetical protein GH714_032949 [Hevea brasiliensis]
MQSGLVGQTKRLDLMVLTLPSSKLVGVSYGEVVSVSQLAFIKGKQILDGILIASELVHSLKKEKRSGVLFKIDFDKAFDLVNWRDKDRIRVSLD